MFLYLTCRRHFHFLFIGVAYYKTQLWIFNLTTHDAMTESDHMYMWSESQASSATLETRSYSEFHVYSI